MNTSFFIVKKIAFSKSKSFSAFIVRIAMVAVALSMMTMIVTTALVNGFQKEIRNKVFAFWSHVHIKPYQLSDSYKQAGVPLNQSFYVHPNTLPETRHIQATALKAALLKTKTDFEGIGIKGVGADFDWSVFTPCLKKGKIFSLDSTRFKQILISKITASRLQIDTGDRVLVNFIDKEIKTRAFRVAGIYETGIEDFDKEFAFVDLGVIQELNHWGADTVGGFEVFLKEQNLFKSRAKSYYLTLFGGLMDEETRRAYMQDPLDLIAQNMNSKIENLTLEAVSIKELRPGLFDWLDLQTMNELIILSLMVLVAIINMVTMMLILILDRTNMIGLLKAMGSPNQAIRTLFLTYAGVIIFCGLVLGNFFGLGICLIQKYFHLIKLPQESYFLSYAPISISWSWILAINVGTILISLLVLLIPSILITKISPVKAIRFA